MVTSIFRSKSCLKCEKTMVDHILQLGSAHLKLWQYGISLAHTPKNILKVINRIITKTTFHILVCIGLQQQQQKTLPPLSYQALPLNQQTVQAPSFQAIPPLYWFFVTPLTKSWIFQWSPKILKFFMLNSILSFKRTWYIIILNYNGWKKFNVFLCNTIFFLCVSPSACFFREPMPLFPRARSLSVLHILHLNEVLSVPILSHILKSNSFLK